MTSSAAPPPATRMVLTIQDSPANVNPQPTRGVPWTAILAGLAAVAALGGTLWAWWWMLALPAAIACFITELVRRSRARERAHRSGSIAAELRSVVMGSLPAQTPRAASESDTPGEGTLHLGIAAIRKLALERDNLRDVIDAVGDPLLVTDESGSVRLWNSAAQLFLARGPDRLLGRSIEELFTSAELVSVHASACAGETRHAIVRLPREGGIRSYEALASPVAWRASGSARLAVSDDADTDGVPDRAGAVLSLRDVTELATAGQLKTDFVANASHELRTPLASIRGAIETLMDDSEDPGMRARLLRMIANNVARLEDLTRDLLDLSRLESTDEAPAIALVRGSALADSLSVFFEESCARRGLSLRFELDPALELIHSDQRLLELVLRNLIENSIKFAHEGTPIRIVGEAIPVPAGTGRAGMRLRVIDLGQGIPLAAQQRIFERFYQVDPSRSGHADRRGTGLGLAIVKHGIKTLGGTISVESVWQQGTTMTVEIPACVELLAVDAPGAGQATLSK